MNMEMQSNEDTLIPVDAEVRCTDGTCGRSTCVLINPITKKVTHLVVKAAAAPHKEYIVPVDSVVEATTDLIQLRCAGKDLAYMDPFVKTEFIEENQPITFPVGFGTSAFSYGSGNYVYWPYAVSTIKEAVERPEIPQGELVIRRGTRVEATDGTVGHVDEFLVQPDTGNITHLVMREGHLWGQKDVSIPISAIRETRDKTVFLNLDTQQVASLPTIPVHRS